MTQVTGTVIYIATSTNVLQTFIQVSIVVDDTSHDNTHFHHNTNVCIACIYSYTGIHRD